MKAGRTCGVYVIRSGNRRRAYVGESVACEDRQTYRLAKLLGWPVSIARVLPPSTSRADRMKAEAEVAKELQQQGIWVVSNAIGLARRSRVKEALSELSGGALLTPKEAAAWMSLAGLDPRLVEILPHLTIGKRTRRYFAKDILAHFASRAVREENGSEQTAA